MGTPAILTYYKKLDQLLRLLFSTIDKANPRGVAAVMKAIQRPRHINYSRRKNEVLDGWDFLTGEVSFFLGGVLFLCQPRLFNKYFPLNDQKALNLGASLFLLLERLQNL